MQHLVKRAQSGDAAAFEALIKRYQNMALGCALSHLGDFHRAEDVVQEASISAYYGMGKLADPAKFGGWFRGIVLNHCRRVLRRREPMSVPIEAHFGVAAADGDPADAVQNRYEVNLVLNAVGALPETCREIVLLFYMDDRSQAEIARLLDIPVATVNNRLHAARTTLKRRTLAMLKETLSERKLGDDFAPQIGEIVKVRGPIISVRVDSDAEVQALDSLKVVEDGHKSTFAVAQRLGGGLVRCVPVRPRNAEAGEMPSLKSGTAIAPAEIDIMEEVGEPELARIVEVFTAPRRRRTGILETGIKVIDLFCPLTAGGSVALFGLGGVGKAVVLGELTRRLAADDDGLAVFGLGKRSERALGQESIRKDSEFFGLVDRTGSIDTAHLVTDLASDPDYAAVTDVFDAAIYCSVELAARNIWPAIDPRVSHSKALTGETAGQAHVDVAERARQALARAAELTVDPVFLRYLAHGSRNLAARRAAEWVEKRVAELGEEDRILVDRARKLELFMGQPMMVAEPYSKTPSRHVPLAETVAAVADILDGKYDALPVEAFRYKNGIDEVVGAS